MTTPPAEKPKHNIIKVTIGTDGIQVRNDNPRGNDGDQLDYTKVWGTCGDPVEFHINNTSGVPQTVRIPPAEFIPSPKFHDKRPPSPMRSGQHTIELPAGSVERTIVVMIVNECDHFGWDNRTEVDPPVGMTYKYTIYSNKHFLDPDIEINPR